MPILHTEASPGWGGQEIRILQEAIGMRARGYTLFFAVQKGGSLVHKARSEGFKVYEVSFSKKSAFITLCKLIFIIWKHHIKIVNTHSSLDAWIGGFAGKLMRCFLIRTRHLSTPIRKGFNSLILYNFLAHKVVTTSKNAEEKIRLQARLSNERIKTVATGVDPKKLLIDPIHVQAFRKRYGIEEEDCLVGTLCVIRGWKGISDLLHAAKELKNVPRLKWIVVGGGVSEAHFLEERKALGLEEHVVFTGHLDHPYVALAALDIFLLLSWAHEGISQSALQASFLEKPLVTTPVGGLGEVCLDRVTGLLVEPCAPRKVAEAVLKLYAHPHLRSLFGAAGKKHVESNFTFEKTLNEMEEFYCKGKKI